MYLYSIYNAHGKHGIKMMFTKRKKKDEKRSSATEETSQGNS